jgi:hypothetical protein
LLLVLVLNGKLKVNFRADTALRNGINAPGAFSGHRCAPKTAWAWTTHAGYKALWDADHPDDPLEV